MRVIIPTCGFRHYEHQSVNRGAMSGQVRTGVGIGNQFVLQYQLPTGYDLLVPLIPRTNTSPECTSSWAWTAGYPCYQIIIFYICHVTPKFGIVIGQGYIAQMQGLYAHNHTIL